MGFDTHRIAGGRACPTPTRPTHPIITNETSPHFAEALTWDLILKRKSPGSCEGFEGDVVAEGLELGNGPTRFSSLVAAHGHAGLISNLQVSAMRTAVFPGDPRTSMAKLSSVTALLLTAG